MVQLNLYSFNIFIFLLPFSLCVFLLVGQLVENCIVSLTYIELSQDSKEILCPHFLYFLIFFNTCRRKCGRCEWEFNKKEIYGRNNLTKNCSCWFPLSSFFFCIKGKQVLFNFSPNNQNCSIQTLLVNIHRNINQNCTQNPLTVYFNLRPFNAFLQIYNFKKWNVINKYN